MQGLQFYWSVGEYDENGNIVFDGGWRGSNGTWTVGVTENGDTGYGTEWISEWRRYKYQTE